MNKFFDSLQAALENANIDCHGIAIDCSGSNRTMRVVRKHAGAKPNGYGINFDNLEIVPSKTRPHCIDVSLIFVGRDSDGYPWSDNMGGIWVDCNGLTSSAAITKIVDDICANFADWFNN